MVNIKFNQIISKIKQNKYATSSPWLPNPVRGARRELVSGVCSNRAQTFSDYDTPGRAITSPTAVNTDATVTVLKGQSDCCAETNAKRRTRSTGNKTDNFLLTTQSYLEKSGKAESTSALSSYRAGDSIATSDGFFTQQLYKPINLTRQDSSVRVTVPNTVAFQYQWLNGDLYDVVLPVGIHNLETVNLIFRNTMFNNKHYLIDTAHSNKHLFFMRFVYDAVNNRNQIQCKGLNSNIYFSSQYKPWTSYSLAVDWMLPEYTLVPCIVFNNAEFAMWMGFEYGQSYPEQRINGDFGTQPETVINQENNYFATNPFYYANGMENPHIKSKFMPIVYRPLNNYFSQNGAVSSSSLISKKIYNTVTRNGTNDLSVNYRQFDDTSVAYRGSSSGYSLKFILGFDDKCFINCYVNKV